MLSDNWCTSKCKLRQFAVAFQSLTHLNTVKESKFHFLFSELILNNSLFPTDERFWLWLTINSVSGDWEMQICSEWIKICTGVIALSNLGNCSREKRGQSWEGRSWQIPQAESRTGKVLSWRTGKILINIKNLVFFRKKIGGDWLNKAGL